MSNSYSFAPVTKLTVQAFMRRADGSSLITIQIELNNYSKRHQTLHVMDSKGAHLGSISGAADLRRLATAILAEVPEPIPRKKRKKQPTTKKEKE